MKTWTIELHRDVELYRDGSYSRFSVLYADADASKADADEMLDALRVLGLPAADVEFVDAGEREDVVEEVYTVTLGRTAVELAANDVASWREEHPGEPLDEPWFTTAYEYERAPGCAWAAYWDAVQRIYDHGHLTDDERERVLWAPAERPGGPVGGGSIGTRTGTLDGVDVSVYFNAVAPGRWSERPVDARFGLSHEIAQHDRGATEPLTDAMILALRGEAGGAGDVDMVASCDYALAGDGDHRAACAEAINAARSMDDSRPLVRVVP